MKILSPISDHPEKFLARGLSQLAKKLGYAKTDEFRKRIEEVLASKGKPLTLEDIDTITDIITSRIGTHAIGEVNNALFRRFIAYQKEREGIFLSDTAGRLASFETGGIQRHNILTTLSLDLRKFAKEEENKEPGNVSVTDIDTYIAKKQDQAIDRQNKGFFLEACKNGSTEILYTCENTDKPITLCYDAVNNIIGGWDGTGIVGNRIISGVVPTAPAFYGDDITVPCFDQKGRLCLIEFDPHGNFGFHAPANHLSLISPKSIEKSLTSVSTLTGEDICYYIINRDDTQKVLNSGPGATINSNKPIQIIKIGGDTFFISHESTGSCGSTKIHSLQTGGILSISDNKIEKIEETKSEDRKFHLREKGNFWGTIQPRGKHSIEWNLGYDFWRIKSFSLTELQAIWEKAYKNAKTRNTGKSF